VNPTSILGGVMAVVMVAYLASVYLTWDGHRLGDDEMAEYFRKRAIIAAVVAGVFAFAGIFVLHHDAPFLYSGLTSRGLPAVIVSALCGLGSLVLLMRHAARWARVLAAGAVATIVLGWGMAQWDYVLPQSLTVAQAAAPSGTITAVLIATAIAVIVLGPSFALLYTLDQRSLLPGEGVHDQASTSSSS
jgi:cytochrome d ubiquinol oxidase subunit II